MEKNKQQNNEDAFVKKYLKELELQTPSLDFTKKIMDVLVKEEKLLVAKNEPLISKKIWVLIASFVGVCVYFVFKDNASSGIAFPELDLSYLSKMEMPNLLGSLTISNSILSVLALFTLFFFVQIFFLKNHFEKRLKF